MWPRRNPNPNLPSLRRGRVRRLVMGIAVAVGVLAAAEGVARGLRGPPRPAMGVVAVSGAVLVEEGASVRLQHASDARQDVVVARAKGSRPRVVFLGGSTVRHSWTTPDDQNFPTHVARALPDVEVLNLASPGQTVASLHGLLRGLDALAPDLVVLHAGHNDYARLVFGGRVRWSTSSSSLLVFLVTRSSLFSTLAAMVPVARVRGANLVVGSGGVTAINDPLAIELSDVMTDDLRRDLRVFVRDSPAPVLLTTLWRSWEHPPPGVLTDAAHPGCAAFAGTVSPRPPNPASMAARSAEACGATASVTRWLEGRAAAERGDRAAALSAWRDSLAQNPLPVVAPFAADDTLREVASEEGACLLDLGAALNGLPPDGDFHDPVHFSARGAERVAGVVAASVTTCLAGLTPAR